MKYKLDGAKLKAIRESNGLTQKELGEKVGLSDVRIRQYEIGNRTPKLYLLEKIAVALDVPVYALWDMGFLKNRDIANYVIHEIEKLHNVTITIISNDQ